MGQLFIWTSSKADIIKEALGPAFGRLPDVPKNSVVALEEDTPPPIPEPGDVVLVMGGKCLKVLQQNKMVHGGRTVESLRQSAIVSKGGGWYLTTLDPFMVRTRADAPSLIRQDVALACRLALLGTVDPPLGQYRIVDDLSDLVVEINDRLEADLDGYVELACDTETLELHPEAADARLVTIQFTLDPGTADVLFFDDKGATSSFNRDCIDWLLTNPRILLSGANWKYDSRWINRHLGILCTNLSKDTLILGSLIDENRSNSLKTHAYEYTNYGGYDRLEQLGYDKARMDLVPPPVLKDYAGCDTDVTLQVGRKLKTEMEHSPKLVRLYRKVILPASRVFEAMEHEGVCVDLDKFSILRNDLSVELETLEQQMLQMMPARLRAKYSDKIADQLASEKSPLTPALLKEFFFTPYGLNLKPLMVTAKTQEPSTAKAHLMMFEDHPEAMAFVELLNQHTSAAKTRSTFVDGFLNHLRADGRLHPSYFLFAGAMEGLDEDAGTVTGRSSCRDPAFQCMVGETMVSTDRGRVRLDKIVADEGRGYRVLTHTGAWRDVVGVYRNGVRPVLRIETASGRVILCTENHPLLTKRGWVRSENLREGDVCYALQSDSRPFDEWAHQSRVSVVGRYEKPLRQPHQQGFSSLRGEGYNLRPEVGDFRGVFGGYGFATGGHESGPCRRQRALLEVELPMGVAETAGVEPAEHQADYAQRENDDRGRVGQAGGYKSWSSALPSVTRYTDEPGAIENQAADRGIFAEDRIVSISRHGERETFDLTIDRCHSFVANGIVVHNTIPKKTKWAKRIRECYPAPPGRRIVAFDFSQGELKIVACIANEQNMIAAYRQGLDLHSVTAAAFMGISYEEFLALEQSDPFTHTLMRTGAKAGNFGLLYGMRENGFKRYARNVYNVKMTDAETKERREAFFNLYPGLLGYHAAREQEIRKTGQVVSPLGRVRHLPLVNSPDREAAMGAILQGINAPVQSTLNDLTWYALVKIAEVLPQERLPFFGMVHDQVLAYPKEDEAEELAVQAKQIMDNLPIEKELKWSHALQFTSDGEIGPNLAKLTKMAS